MTKTIESERLHVDVEGRHSTIVTFDDGSEETFHGFRKVEPDEIGEELPEGFLGLAVVQHNGVLALYWIAAAWPDSNAYGLGNYYRAKGEYHGSTITVCTPEWCGKTKP
jgi:hypothetical protein